VTCRSVSLSNQGNSSVFECVGGTLTGVSADDKTGDEGGEIVVAPPPPVVTLPPPNQGNPSGCANFYGYTEAGVGKCYQDEVLGRVDEPLYVPNKANPALVIFPGDVREIIYPECAGRRISDVPAFGKCSSGTGSLRGDVTYVQRLKLDANLRLPRSAILLDPTNAGNNDHGEWTAWISTEPGNGANDSSYPQCTIEGYAMRFYLNDRYSSACLIPSDLINQGNTGVVYLNFKATGPKRSQCGKGGYLCRMYTNAW